jgi:hypothetical protein
MLVTKSPFVISDTIDNLVIVINVNSGAYYSLSKIGSELWTKIENGQTAFSQIEMQYIKSFVEEEILCTEDSLVDIEKADFSEVAQKFTDMEEMLMGDPIHEVDSQGWPALKKETP